MKNILTISLLLTVTLIGCDYELRKGYGAGASSSISDSKKLGVFIMEYQPIAVHINDTIEFNVYEAYAEIVFFRDDTIRKIDGCQIVMHADVNKYFRKIMDTSFYWYLDDFYAGSNGGVDITEGVSMYYSPNIETLEAPDSLKIDIMMSYPNGPNEYNTTIKAGEFYLIKKLVQQ